MEGARLARVRTVRRVAASGNWAFMAMNHRARAVGRCTAGWSRRDLRLRTESEVPAGDFGWGHPHVVRFERRGPGQQLGTIGFADFHVGFQQPGTAPDDYAPSFGDVVVVGLEDRR